jgi:hypothetical protein
MNCLIDLDAGRVVAVSPQPIMVPSNGRVLVFHAADDSAVEVGWLWDAVNRVPVAPPISAAAIALSAAAAAVLARTDTTMHRITEAVALGTNTWTGADVVAWVSYRRALRQIADGSDTAATTLPIRPAYPAGT